MDLKTLKDTPPWNWPQDAGESLLAALRDRQRQPADRLLAAELAGDMVVMTDEVADQLLSVARDPAEPGNLRGAAAIALGPVIELSDQDGFEDEDAPIAADTFQSIQGILRDIFLDPQAPKEVRRRALEASVRAPRPWHADAVQDRWSSGDPEWALTAVFCMRYVRGFASQILEALGSDREDLRYEAICAAGDQAVEEAWPAIARLLSPKAPKPLLLAAIDAAAYVAPEGEALAPLEGLLRSRDDDVVDAVHEALGMIEALEEGEEDFEDEHQGTWH